MKMSLQKTGSGKAKTIKHTFIKNEISMHYTITHRFPLPVWRDRIFNYKLTGN